MNIVYEVLVGNIGTVYSGYNRKAALECFNIYVDPETRPGRAEKEVVFLKNGEPQFEFWFDLET